MGRMQCLTTIVEFGNLIATCELIACIPGQFNDFTLFKEFVQGPGNCVQGYLSHPSTAVQCFILEGLDFRGFRDIHKIFY